MIPVKIDEKDYTYPDFQPDQLLTADDLNRSFNFLDMEGRLTRTNLIGIGILCGLEVSKSSDGKTVYITKGTGVTSHGYIMSHGVENSNEAISYKKYRNFDALKDKRYSVFATDTAPKYALWELIDQTHEQTSDYDLSTSFLSNKVCLLFYEIINEKAKNCDPTSCADKGVKVFVNIRRLLISSTDADSIISELNTKAKESGSGEFFPGIHNLADIRMPRFDVLATDLETTGDIYDAYQKVFTKNFVEGVGNALKQAFELFKKPLDIHTNPFLNFNSRFAFLHNGTISVKHLLHFQYFYDFFSDLLLAYNEWRETALKLDGLCTPPEALFPRHLFLGGFSSNSSIEKSKYRNYFIPSPIHTRCKDLYKKFETLFQRIDYMVTNLQIPVPTVGGKLPIDTNIRITPTVTGRNLLGDRSIPYYYDPNDSPRKLIEVWNPELTAKGKELQILHYDPSYNTTDDFVKNPLEYDLEPYNFFLIEGHIGKEYSSALASVLNIRDKNRLPFDVVAVSADSLPGTVDTTKFACHFNDLEGLYESLRAALICRLCKIVACLYKIPNKLVAKREKKLIKSELELIKGCKDVLHYNDNTIGIIYEKTYSLFRESRSSRLTILDKIGSESLAKSMKAAIIKGLGIEDSKEIEVNIAVATFISELIELLSTLAETLPEKLSDYNYNEMSKVLKKISDMIQQAVAGKITGMEDQIDQNQCLRDIMNLCDLASFQSIYVEYTQRVQELKLKQTLSQFSKVHPGLMHKGGVPVGGTFIIVYRDLESDTNVSGVKKSLSLDDFIISDSDGKTYEKAIAEEKAIKNLAKSKYSAKEIAVLKKKVDLLKLKGLSDAEIEESLGIKISDISGIISTFNDQLIKIGHGIVVADFYLPYLCCSDCSPVQFVVNILPPKVTFSLKTLSYCKEDPDEYIFTANPAGGKIITDQPDAIIDKGSGIYAFMPSKIKVPDGQSKVSVDISYVKDDLSQTITVTVYIKPEVKIIATVNPNNPLQYTFSLEPVTLVTSAAWKFGDGAVSSQMTPAHTYEAGGEYKVEAEVKNGVCTGKPEDVVLKVSDPEPVKITIETRDICKDVEKISFTITPAGGTLTGEAWEEDSPGSGKYVFFPPKVAMNGLSRKTITFNYTSKQGQPGTFVITVYDKPEGTSSVIPSGELKLMVFFDKLKNAAEAIVDFGDKYTETYNAANLTQLKTSVHQYAKGGTYTIKTTLKNGTCITRLPDIKATVESSQPGKECEPFSVPVKDFIPVSKLIEKTPRFSEIYKPVLPDLLKFYDALDRALSGSSRFNISFFKDYPVKSEWITLLPVSPAAAKTITVQMLVNFTEILTSLMCNSNEDISTQNLNLFKKIIDKLNSIPKLTEAEKELLIGLIELLKKEMKKIKTYNETDVKARYLEILTELINVLEKMTGN